MESINNNYAINNILLWWVSLATHRVKWKGFKKVSSRWWQPLSDSCLILLKWNSLLESKEFTRPNCQRVCFELHGSHSGFWGFSDFFIGPTCRSWEIVSPLGREEEYTGHLDEEENEESDDSVGHLRLVEFVTCCDTSLSWAWNRSEKFSSELVKVNT